jgi:ABC-type transport system involved in multi-copper enzyme maturation permease subunit
MPMPMPLRLGPGPVFIHESIAAARRWQLYLLRSLFVLGLLAGLVLPWLMMSLEEGKLVGSVNIKQLAAVGQYFYLTIATIQVVLVLIIAPAATAGAICQDRARGTLTHMLVTELADSEIVLGKLAARLAPVFALVAATVPVLALAGLLGGVIIEAIVVLVLITLALAVLGCALALAFSVRATKTHEVLMAVYGIEIIWVLGPLIWMLLVSAGAIRGVPDWFVKINPFVLAWAPYAWPKWVSLEWLAAMLGGTVTLSVGLAAYAVLRLRAETTNRSSPRATRLAARLDQLRAKLSAWRPQPSLDRDPVLWREWRRSRPSRLARIIWGIFMAASFAGTAWGLGALALDRSGGAELLEFVSGLQATFGLLLVSLAAPTVLAEERARGSLDVLLTTPLPTDRIVLAKWWGAYRVVPALALLPAIGAIFIAAGEPDFTRIVRRFGQPPVPLGTLDRMVCVGLPVAALLVQGAVVTSIGFALATWVPRLGRAVAISVTTYAFFAFGWPISVEIISEILIMIGMNLSNGTVEFIALLFVGACPFGGQLVTFQAVNLGPSDSRGAFYVGQVIVLLATLVFALVVLALALATFDRCMGRMSERPRRPPRPPGRATWMPKLRVRTAALE